MKNQIFFIFLSFALGIVSTLIVQHILDNRNNITIYRKLLEEIRWNNKQAQTMELTGKFADFEVKTWDEFKGTNAFYILTDDIKRTLDSYYTILKWYNTKLLKFKKLEEKEKWEMKAEVFVKLTIPYIQFLLEKKIIKKSDATPQWIIAENQN